MSSYSHTHQLSDGQLICDNEQCRENAMRRIEEIKNHFDQIVQKNSTTNERIDRQQGWKIVHLTSIELANRLTLLFHEEEIRDMIEKFLKHQKTKQAFDQAFDHQMIRQTTNLITGEQLWRIYLHLCRHAVEILSKTKQERRIYMAK